MFNKHRRQGKKGVKEANKSSKGVVRKKQSKEEASDKKGYRMSKPKSK